jgi:MFS transporter, UMF1 family
MSDITQEQQHQQEIGENDLISQAAATAAAPDQVDVVTIQIPSTTATSIPLQRQLSVSESASISQHGGWHAPYYLKVIEMPFRIKDYVNDMILPEATGWCMDSTARGPFNQMGGFIGTAILRLATVDAGCKSVQTCTNTVRGLRPSSYLAATSAIVSIVGALLMPIAGAVIDHTRYRKHVGVISAILVVTLTGFEMLISQRRNNWFFILIIDSFQSFFLNVHATASLAYLPDLTINEQVLTHYTSQFSYRQFGNNIIYICLILVANYIYGTEGRTPIDTSVFTARVAAGMAFGYGILLYSYSWIFLFRNRPALSKVPDGTTLMSAGFIQVARTARKIWSNYSALKWFLISLLWTPEIGSGILLSIAVSFFTIQLDYRAKDLAIATISFMIGTLIGVFIFKCCSRTINPLNNYRIGLLVLAISVALSVAVLDDPSKILVSYFFTMAWGIGTGWFVPGQRVLFCTLIPKGQETEMMGIIAFVSQIIQWLPPFIVTIMNENSIELRYGLLPVSGFILLAILCTLPMGSYSVASELVARDSADKLQQVVLATSGVTTSIINSEKKQQQEQNQEPTSDINL